MRIVNVRKREQAEAARNQSAGQTQTNIIDESQAPTEEFVPRDQAAAWYIGVVQAAVGALGCVCILGVDQLVRGDRHRHP